MRAAKVAFGALRNEAGLQFVAMAMSSVATEERRSRPGPAGAFSSGSRMPRSASTVRAVRAAHSDTATRFATRSEEDDGVPDQEGEHQPGGGVGTQVIDAPAPVLEELL